MSEIMRAVLQESCLASRPYWYGSEVTFDRPTIGPVNISGTFKVRENTHFLLCGFNYVTVTYKVPPTNFILVVPGAGQGSLSTLNLRNLDNGKAYMDPSTLGRNVATDLTNPWENQEYVYMPPGSRVGWSMANYDNFGSVGGAGYKGTTTMTFMGIEFLMKGVAHEQTP